MAFVIKFILIIFVLCLLKLQVSYLFREPEVTDIVIFRVPSILHVWLVLHSSYMSDIYQNQVRWF